MKGIVCLILIVLTWGECVEEYWNLMRNGKYGEAAVQIEKYFSESKKISDVERLQGDSLIQKANACQEMLARSSSENLEYVDVIRVHKNKMLFVCQNVMGCGSIKTLENGGAEFITNRGNKRLVSQMGENGFDIYRQFFGEEMERLSKVVNSDGNEVFPFEMSDGVTLYFGSDGHGSIGGYDIFMTRYNSEIFDYSEPQTVGMPYNTLANDYMMMVDDITGLILWVTDDGMTSDSVKVIVAKMENYENLTEDVDCENSNLLEVEELMTFVVNDHIIYHKLEDFKCEQAKALYVSLRELEKDINVIEILLENKRKIFVDVTDDESREQMKIDIMDDERYVVESKIKIKQMVKTIRQLELKRYE